VSRQDGQATGTRAPADCRGFVTELILRCGRGDEAALGRLFDLFHAPVAAAVQRQGHSGPTDELVLDVFLRVWRHAPTFVPGDRGAVDWLLGHATAETQPEIVTSPAVTTAGWPRTPTVRLAFQTPVSGNR